MREGGAEMIDPQYTVDIGACVRCGEDGQYNDTPGKGNGFGPICGYCGLGGGRDYRPSTPPLPDPDPSCRYCGESIEWATVPNNYTEAADGYCARCVDHFAKTGQ